MTTWLFYSMVIYSTVIIKLASPLIGQKWMFLNFCSYEHSYRYIYIYEGIQFLLKFLEMKSLDQRVCKFQNLLHCLKLPTAKPLLLLHSNLKLCVRVSSISLQSRYDPEIIILTRSFCLMVL